MMYIQVDLKKDNKVDTVWIEDKKIKVGNVVELKREDDGYDPGWEVTATYGKATREVMVVSKNAYRTHRSRTDI